MPHDLADLIAELDQAKANLARSVKRCRTLVGGRRKADEPGAEKSVFKWAERDER